MGPETRSLDPSCWSGSQSIRPVRRTGKLSCPKRRNTRSDRSPVDADQDCGEAAVLETGLWEWHSIRRKFVPWRSQDLYLSPRQLTLVRNRLAPTYWATSRLPHCEHGLLSNRDKRDLSPRLMSESTTQRGRHSVPQRST